MSEEPMNLSCLDGMTCRRIGKVVNFHRSVPSTNDLAKEMADGGCADGTVVFAEEQTGGKGRAGRRWTSSEGGIYLSVVLKGEMDLKTVNSLPLIFGLAVSKTISTSAMIESGLKWPNDVLIGEKKVCGVLMEASVKAEEVEYVVVGIGLNVNNSLKDLDEETRERSTTLSDEIGEKLDRRELLRNLLYFLDLHYDRYLEGGVQRLLEEWSGRSKTIGKQVSVEDSSGDVVKGKALGVDQTGALMVRSGKKITRILSGDCVHLR